MNLLDLQQLVHTNGINVNTNGHRIIKKEIWINILDERIRCLKENLQSECNIVARKAKEVLYKEIEYKKIIETGPFYNEIKLNCSRCHCYCYCVPILLDDKHIIFIKCWEHWYKEYEQKTGEIFDLTNEIPEEYLQTCRKRKR